VQTEKERKRERERGRQKEREISRARARARAHTHTLAQVGKKKWRCELCEKEFSTVNIMRVHFEKAHKKEAMTWFQEGGAMGGEAQAMEEMMEAMMMMGVCLCLCLCLCPCTRR
jgi:hypothetical protein